MITQYASDGTTALPAIALKYNGDTPSFGPSIKGPPLSGAGGWGDPKYYSTIRTADVNGDGKTDICARSATGVTCWLSDGTGFPTSTTGTSFTNYPSFANPQYYSTIRMADVNGDGKGDICGRSATGVKCWLSDGKGFPTSITGPPLSNAKGWSDLKYYSTIRMADVNGDGKTDICARSATGVTCWLSDGSGFPTQIDGPPLADGYGYSAPQYNSTIMMGDINGDGKSDLCVRGSDGMNCYIVNEDGGDLLSLISNGLGATTRIEYKPSTLYQNPQLPFPVQTVSAITTNDGNNNSSTTSYAFSGGIYHIGERDFRGFNHVTVTGPVDENGEHKISETWFHQGNDTSVPPDNVSDADLLALANVPTGYMKGKPYRTRITDSSGKKYSESTTSYAPDTNGSPYFNPPYQVDSYTYGAADIFTQTRTIYTYDGYGNVIREDQYGDVSNANDDRTIIRSFSPNTSKWITGLPASEGIYQGIGTTSKVAGKTYYYDDLTTCNATPTNNQTPAYGKLTRMVSWLNGGTSPEVRMAYNSFGNLICQRDAKGNTSTVAYDASNTFPTLVTNPLVQQTITQYYGVNGVSADKGLYGQVKSVTDPNIATTVLEYDIFGRKTKETSPDGVWTSLSYNNFGTVGSQNVRTDNSAGLWKASYFDGLGRIFREKSSGPDRKTIAKDTIYNITGTLKQASLPYFDGTETPKYQSYVHDPLGRVTKESNPDTTCSLTCYNDSVTVGIDANGHRRREVHDSHGRLVKIQEYTGNYSTCTTDEGTPYATTQYTYDVLDNLRLVADAKNNQTEMRYDSLGRKYYMSDPDMGVWGYGYDANSNLASQTDAKHQTITFTYDGLDRLSRKNYPSGPNIVLTYDEPTSSNAKGRLTTMTDASGKAVYNYDKMGHVTSTTRTIDSVAYTLGFGYLNGRLNSVSYPGNDSVTYGYDDGGNLQTAGSYARFWNYDALGRPQGITYGNGTIAIYSFNSSTKRLSSLSLASPKGLLIDNSYGYDNVGNLSTITNSLDVKRSQSFTYDELNRLRQSVSNAYGTLAYSYDKIGNIVTKEGVNYSYGVRPHAVASLSSGRTFAYDANGNITNDGRRSIIYNPDNMPTLVNSVSFSYDGNGKRIKKIAGGYTTTYIDKFYECANGACSKFIYAGSNRVALKNGSKTLYYHTDHQGSTSIVTNASGGKVEDIAYYPFGGTRQDTTPDGTLVSHKYTGQENDAETGLYNYDARLYDPEIGRFLTPDSIIPDPENPQSFNRYAYVQNNPINRIDPTGNWDWDWDWDWDFDFGDWNFCLFGCGGDGGGGSGGNGSFVANDYTFRDNAAMNFYTTPESNYTNSDNTTGPGYSGGGGGAASSGGRVESQGPARSISAPPGFGWSVLNYLNTDLHNFVNNTNPNSRTDVFMKYLPIPSVGGVGAGLTRTSSTTLYRAVGMAEANQIIETAKFTVGPNSLGGKFFAETAEHAMKWGELMEGAGNFKVLSVKIPTTVANTFMRWERLDGIGPARYAELNQLKNVVMRWLK